MSNKDRLWQTYVTTLRDKIGVTTIDEALLKAIISYLGPAHYDKDSARVACSDPKELSDVKTNFLVQKLKLKDSEELEVAIQEVCQSFGSNNRNKYRAVFYYLLVQRFKKESLFTDKKGAQANTTKQHSEDTGSSNTAEKGPQDSKKEERDEPHTVDNEDIIRRHALYAAAAGLVPIPLIDLASISAVQYRMIRAIAEQYSHVTFDAQKTKTLIAAISGGVTSWELGMLTRLFFKGVPLIGPLIGGTAISAYAYTATMIIGEIFDDHFASGGNFSLTDLTISKMKEALYLDAIKDRMRDFYPV